MFMQAMHAESGVWDHFRNVDLDKEERVLKVGRQSFTFSCLAVKSGTCGYTESMQCCCMCWMSGHYLLAVNPSSLVWCKPVLGILGPDESIVVAGCICLAYAGQLVMLPDFAEVGRAQSGAAPCWQ